MATLTLVATNVGARDTWTLTAGSTKPLAVNSPDDDDTSYITSPGIDYQDFTGDTSVLSGATISSVVITADIKRNSTPAGEFTIGYSFTPDGGGDQSGSTGPTASGSAYVNYTHSDTGLSVDWGSGFVFWIQGNHATRTIRCSTLYAVEPIEGTVAKTLEALVSESTGTHYTDGTLAKTLADVTASSTGELAIAGTLVKTLGDLTAGAAYPVEGSWTDYPR